MAHGKEYTIALSAEYSVLVDNNDLTLYEAEDEAWNVLEGALANCDAEKHEVYEVIEASPSLIGHRVKLKANFEIVVVHHDMTDAYYEAVELVENISLPENVTLICTEQTDFIMVGERVSA